MGRSPCCSKEGLNKGAWTASEDKILANYIKLHGEGKWRNLPKRAGLKRCGKSCRLRWLNYLRPDIKRGNISRDEEELIIRLHNLLGNRWSLIAGRLPGRTDNEIKNYWNTTLGKKAKAKSSSPCNSPPDGAATKSEVIRTKATRCTKVVYPLQAPSEEIEKNNISTELQDSWNQTEVVHHHLIPGKEIADFNLIPANIDGAEQYHVQLQPFEDDRMFKNWTTSPCSLEIDNVGLDLDSLDFFLYTENWP